MCGRFTLHLSDLSGLASLLGVREVRVRGWQPRYNVAPTQLAPAARRERAGGRTLELMRFGLVPSYARAASRGGKVRAPAPLINARVETVRALRTFREAFERRRCVVPATGFYEWMPSPERRAKQPFWIHPKDGDLLTFAAIYEPGTAREGGAEDGFAIVTTEASPLLREIHDRMPLVLTREGVERWLAGEHPSEQVVAELVDQAHALELAARPVSGAVSSPRNDEPRCIEAVAPEDGAGARDDEADDGQLELF